MKANLGLLLFFIVCACTTRKEQTSQSATDSLRVLDSIRKIPPPEVIKKNVPLEALGRYIAGLDQIDSTSYTKLQKEASWKSYKASTDSSWNRLFNDRLGKMQTWQSSNLATKINDSLSVFYPFSGPDFIHAYYLYPSAKDFILVALEPIMDAVKLDTLSSTTRNSFLDSLSHSLRDSFRKSFFETNNMREDIKRVKGVLPLLYFFVERTGHELIGQQFFYVDSAGSATPTTIAKLYKHRTPGVKLELRDRQTNKIKQLYYFNINMLNDELKRRPGFEKFIKRKKPFNTFVKSASYLMHRDSFTEIKRLITGNSESLFQDDTGIPYSEFKSNLGWNLQFYGDYKKPIKLFEMRYQPDLDSAYKATTTKEPIPFTLGYHYGSKVHNYMLVRKSKTSKPR